jgi:hypothetical protein
MVIHAGAQVLSRTSLLLLEDSWQLELDRTAGTGVWKALGWMPSLQRMSAAMVSYQVSDAKGYSHTSRCAALLLLLLC